jgi:hypothetical protein
VPQVELEVIRLSMLGNGLSMATSYQPVIENVEPLGMLIEKAPGALTHSTSWRWVDNRLLLTFVQVFPDGHEFSDRESAAEYFDAASLPSIECHAVRHLYFLLHTDEEIAATPNLDAFWKFAHDVAEIHHPAVAGLITADDYHI